MKFPAGTDNSASAIPEARIGRLRAGNSLGSRGCPVLSGPSAAFTLAEVLAALVFLAVVIPVAIEGLSLAGRAGEVAVRKGTAALIAERVLDESIVTTNWTQSSASGSVRQGGQDYRWSLRTEAWTEDPNETALRLLSVEVSYTAQGRPFLTRLSTLVDSTPPSTQPIGQSSVVR